MANIELLPHNEEALKKLNECLKNNQMASINHATGTGKSFIILKYLYENRGKRILYLAPTYPIIDQLTKNYMEELGISKDEFALFDSEIYAGLLRRDMEKVAEKYDIIILDEYHRCGAPLWGKKVKELLGYIKKKYPNKKVIGTTATEIRYLDKNRNMNNLLFNGVEASRLTLADAILQGILPPPIYINTNYTLLNDLQEIENNIMKYSFYSSISEKDIARLKDARDKLEQILYSSDEVKQYLQKCKKILVFSNTINSIRKDEKIIQKYMGIPMHSYSVHSGKTHEFNAQQLHDFSIQSGDELSVLYSINILNEGVHVKNVDAIFMLRKTSSPIIYFQQIGRILSFSSRKSDVVVVDLVNNICNHPVIYELYNEVVARAKELVEKEPEKKEHYDKIIERFKIIDKTGSLCKVVDELKEAYKKENIIISRLDTAVSILEGKIEANVVEKYMAPIDIIKYEEYITPELLERIRKLKLENYPSLVNVSQEEFVNYLGKYRNLHEKRSERYSNIYPKVVEFYDENDRLPSIFSDSEDETKLAKLMFNNYYKLTVGFRRFIFDNMTDDLSLMERTIYDTTIMDLDVDRLAEEVKIAIERGIELPPFIKYMISNEGGSFRRMIEEYSKEDEEDDEELKILKTPSRKKLADSILLTEVFQEAANEINKKLQTQSFEDVVKETFDEMKDYMEKNEKEVIFEKFKRVTLDSKDPDRYEKARIEYERIEQVRLLYCKKVLLRSGLEQLGYLKQIEEMAVKISANSIGNAQTANMSKLISFIEAHNGAMPSAKNIDKDEVELAKYFISSRASFSDDEKKIITDLIASHSDEREKIVDEYVSFIETNKRRPMTDNTAPEEIELNEKFNRWRTYLTFEENERVNKAVKKINKYDELRKVYRAINDNKNKPIDE